MSNSWDANPNICCSRLFLCLFVVAVVVVVVVFGVVLVVVGALIISTWWDVTLRVWKRRPVTDLLLH